MYFEGEEALNRLLTRKYRKAEVGLEKCVGMGGKPTISPLVLAKLAIKSRTACGFSEFGSACWARTSDPLINSQLLYQLS